MQNLHTALELGDRQGISISVENMGHIYFEQGDYGNALACYEQDLQIALELGERLGVGRALWCMATAYVAQEGYDQAEQLLGRAVALGRALDTLYELCDYLYTCADLYARQGQHATALSFNDQAFSIAMQVDYREVQFKAQVLVVRLRAALNEIDLPQAITALEWLLDEWSGDEDQATLKYEIWRLDRQRESHRRGASELYRTLYADTPNAVYRQHYKELTGKRLSEPPPLPPLPEIVTRDPIDREVLVTQVDALIGELKAEQA
jgi:tetratricopeptide (TPR) repeat protein